MERDELDRRLASLRDESEPRRRRLLALGLLTARLAAHRIEPILVGGGALEFYTAGGYATHDMDLALPHGAEVDVAFAEKIDEDGRWTRRLALLYADRLDWGYLRERTSRVPEEAGRLQELERETQGR